MSILQNSEMANNKRPIGGESLLQKNARAAGLEHTTQTREMIESERRSQFQRQIYRTWRSGDVYAPHDLSGAEQKKWKYGRSKPQSDAFDVLGINPIHEYKVCVLDEICAK
jgi:small subunit ribosomal protein S18